MLQAMINGSLAIFTRPSLPTFQEHERDNLGWATIYMAIAAVITGLLGAVGSLIRAPFLESQIREIESQFAQLDTSGTDMSQFTDLMVGIIRSTTNPLLNLASNTVSTFVGFYIALLFIFLIGLALGGSSRFGALGYDLALINAPTAMIYGVVSLLSIGPLAILLSLATLGVWGYSLVLTYFGVRSAMGLTHGRALVIALLPVILPFVIVFCSCAFIFLAVLGAAGGR